MELGNTPEVGPSVSEQDTPGATPGWGVDLRVCSEILRRSLDAHMENECFD